MKAAIFKGKGAIELGERPDPTIRMPTDAVVRVALTIVCGSDPRYYRGQSDYAAGSPMVMNLLGVWNRVEKVCKTLRKATSSLHHSFIVTAHIHLLMSFAVLIYVIKFMASGVVMSELKKFPIC